MTEWWFLYLVLPLLIFCARIVDVSLDTLRIVFLNRGRKVVAPVLGFFQALIWVVAISQVMKNLANPACFLAYGAGFAAGNYFGLLIEEKIAAGMLTIRIITSQGCAALVAALRQAGHGATTFTGYGADGPVDILFVVSRRRNMPIIIGLIKEHAPQAFYSTEEVRSITGGTLMSPAWGWSVRAPFRRKKSIVRTRIKTAFLATDNLAQPFAPMIESIDATPPQNTQFIANPPGGMFFKLRVDQR